MATALPLPYSITGFRFRIFRRWRAIGHGPRGKPEATCRSVIRTRVHHHDGRSIAMPGTLPFVNFAFNATGSVFNRTMPNRLSDVQNVKDWGAKGDGSTDDTSAIQSAIDYCVTNNSGGTVFFPSGKYNFSSISGGTNTATYSTSGVRLLGSGKECTFLNPSSGSWVIAANGRTYDCIESIEDLGTQGSVTSGSIQVTRTNVNVGSCSVGSPIGIDATQAIGAFIHNCLLAGPATGNANAGPAKGQAFVTANTIGIAAGTASCLVNNRATLGYDVTYALSGSGASAICCLGENQNTVVRFGWGIASGTVGEVGASECVAQSIQSEILNVLFEFYNADGCAFKGGINSGAVGSRFRSDVQSGTWGAGTATVQTVANHNIGSNGTKVYLQLIFLSGGGTTVLDTELCHQSSRIYSGDSYGG